MQQTSGISNNPHLATPSFSLLAMHTRKVTFRSVFGPFIVSQESYLVLTFIERFTGGVHADVADDRSVFVLFCHPVVNNLFQDKGVDSCSLHVGVFHAVVRFLGSPYISR